MSTSTPMADPTLLATVRGILSTSTSIDSRPKSLHVQSISQLTCEGDFSHRYSGVCTFGVVESPRGRMQLRDGEITIPLCGSAINVDHLGKLVLITKFQLISIHSRVKHRSTSVAPLCCEVWECETVERATDHVSATSPTAWSAVASAAAKLRTSSHAPSPSDSSAEASVDVSVVSRKSKLVLHVEGLIAAVSPIIKTGKAEHNFFFLELAPSTPPPEVSDHAHQEFVRVIFRASHNDELRWHPFLKIGTVIRISHLRPYRIEAPEGSCPSSHVSVEHRTWRMLKLGRKSVLSLARSNTSLSTALPDNVKVDSFQLRAPGLTSARGTIKAWLARGVFVISLEPDGGDVLVIHTFAPLSGDDKQYTLRLGIGAQIVLRGVHPIVDPPTSSRGQPRLIGFGLCMRSQLQVIKGASFPQAESFVLDVGHHRGTFARLGFRDACNLSINLSKVLELFHFDSEHHASNLACSLAGVPREAKARCCLRDIYWEFLEHGSGGCCLNTVRCDQDLSKAHFVHARYFPISELKSAIYAIVRRWMKRGSHSSTSSGIAGRELVSRELIVELTADGRHSKFIGANRTDGVEPKLMVLCEIRPLHVAGEEGFASTSANPHLFALTDKTGSLIASAPTMSTCFRTCVQNGLASVSSVQRKRFIVGLLDVAFIVDAVFNDDSRNDGIARRICAVIRPSDAQCVYHVPGDCGFKKLRSLVKPPNRFDVEPSSPLYEAQSFDAVVIKRSPLRVVDLRVKDSEHLGTAALECRVWAQVLGFSDTSIEQRLRGLSEAEMATLHLPPKCSRCGRPGHDSNDCFAKTDVNGAVLAPKPKWICPGCGNDNFASRKVCHQCTTARPVDVRPKRAEDVLDVEVCFRFSIEAESGTNRAFNSIRLALATMHVGSRFRVSDFVVDGVVRCSPADVDALVKHFTALNSVTSTPQASQTSQIKKRSVAIVQVTPSTTFTPLLLHERPRLFVHASSKSKRKSSGVARKGDWRCGDCDNVNFAWRTKCNMCARLKADPINTPHASESRKHHGQFLCSASPRMAVDSLGTLLCCTVSIPHVASSLSKRSQKPWKNAHELLTRMCSFEAIVVDVEWLLESSAVGSSRADIWHGGKQRLTVCAVALTLHDVFVRCIKQEKK